MRRSRTKPVALLLMGVLLLGAVAGACGEEHEGLLHEDCTAVCCLASAPPALTPAAGASPLPLGERFPLPELTVLPCHLASSPFRPPESL
jgi:hypothetical protein